jgi:hypothetical protein
MADEQTATGHEPARTTITAEELAGMLQQRGFRAELTAEASGAPIIRSASQGILFHIRPGNRVQGGEERFLDYSFVCPLQLEIPPAAELLAAWNAGRRFARAYGHDRLFVLEMDVLLAGGVAEGHLQATLEVWDHLLQEVVSFLRQRLTAAAAEGSAAD